MCLICPILLQAFAGGPDLDREGGAYNVAMIMDWREMVGRATVPTVIDIEWASPMFAAGANARSWVLAFSWVSTAFVE